MQISTLKEKAHWNEIPWRSNECILFYFYSFVIASDMQKIHKQLKVNLLKAIIYFQSLTFSTNNLVIEFRNWVVNVYQTDNKTFVYKQQNINDCTITHNYNRSYFINNRT